MELADYLRFIRKKNNLTSGRLSKLLSCSTTTCINWENGKSKPASGYIYRLENIYSLPPGTISRRLAEDARRKINKKVYVIHPLRGSAPEKELKKHAAKNKTEVTVICKALSKTYPDVLILSPIHLFSYMDVTGDQEQAFSYCEALLETADEAWVFGDWQNSEGCKREIALAKELKIRTRYFDE